MQGMWWLNALSCLGTPNFGVCPLGFQLKSRELKAEVRAGHEFCTPIPEHPSHSQTSTPIPEHPCSFLSIHAPGGMQWGLQHLEMGHVWDRVLWVKTWDWVADGFRSVDRDIEVVEREG